MKHIISWKLFISAVALILSAYSFSCSAQTYLNGMEPKQVPPEQQTKLMEYVIENVTWPANTNSTKFNLCVLGNARMQAFDNMNGQTISNKKIAIQKASALKKVANNCHMLYVSQSEFSNQRKIIDKFTDKPVLLISELHDFAADGGDINFFMANNSLALKINTFAMRQSKLEMSKDMMKLLTIIPDLEPEPEVASDTEEE